MKAKIAGGNLRTIKQLSRQLKRIWKSFSPDFAEKLAESCQRRCQDIIDSGGDWINY